MKYLRYILFWLAGIPVCGYTQEENPVRFTFQRQNNFTYSTQWDLNLQKEIGKYRFSVYSHHDNLYNSLLKPPFIQVNLFHRIWQYYGITKKLSAASWIETDQYLHNKNQRYNFYGGLEYRIKEKIILTPLMGYSWDYLNQRMNHGISPGLKLQAEHQWEDGLQMQTRLFYREKFIRPRHQRNLSFVSAWEKSFENKAGIAASISAGSNEMDTYKQNSVEKIISDTLSGTMRVEYHPWQFFYFSSDNQMGLMRRKFEYAPYLIAAPEFNNTRFEQIDINAQQKAGFRFPKTEGFLSYNFSMNDRRYTVSNTLGLTDREYAQLTEKEVLKDFIRTVHQTQFQVQWRVNPRHRLVLTGDNRYVMYDTPSETNFDDHDELNYGLKGEWLSKWAGNFSTTYSLDGSRRQYSFLFKEKSQDNYTQYVLRAELEHIWNIVPKLRWRGTHWIYVNYNVKDFEDITLSNRSNRNLEIKWEFQYTHNPKWQFTTTLYRKESQLSYLNWEKFAETTLDTTETVFIEQKNTCRLFQKEGKGTAWLDFGYKHFYLFRFQNALMYDTLNILTPINLHIRGFQTGPLTGIRWLGKKNASIETMIWWQYQLQDNRYSKIDKFPPSLISYKEVDLLKVNIAFRPFGEIKVQYFF
ncbi:MAG: hypothetical protein K1X92_14320 [Bacteroidia bacterium]|nr:hypothetical protein [Bacteroidia bacterium]